MTKCEDSVWRIRGRNWPKSRNKEMSQVTVHTIGLCQLQVQRLTGGTKSSSTGDSQAKDFTATCLVLWVPISSSSNPGWPPSHMYPLSAISIKLDWTTLQKECANKQESYSGTISWPLAGRSPGGGHGNPFQYSCLENPMDWGAWEVTFHGATREAGGQLLYCILVL